MNQVTENLGLNIGGITDEPSLIPNMVTNLIKIDQAAGQGSADPVARAAAAAAQADATQALADAATASTAAAGAATTAAAAEALAQQAIAAGIELKRLSTTEVENILALNDAEGTGILSYTYASDQVGYVLNCTPRVKLVFAEEVLTDRSVGTTANKQMSVRNVAQSGNKPTMSLISEINILTKHESIRIFYQYGGINAETTVSPAPSTKDTLIVSLCGIVTYDHDIDLGTDIV